jgi:uncharacterized damage-inducible protein DinB
MEDLRYPVGKFKFDPEISTEKRLHWIKAIGGAPAALAAAVDGLTASQLDVPYRPGGWTVRQVIHHVADSHMNAFVRFKLALTEDKPTIKPYDQDGWANTPDAGKAPIEASLALVAALHERWVTLLESLKPDDFRRALIHPEIGEIDLDKTLQIYAWHGGHHAAQITALRRRERL